MEMRIARKHPSHVKGQRIVLGMLVSVALAGILAQQPSAGQWLSMADAAANQFDWTQALGWYARAETLDPSAVEPALGIARLRLWRGEIAQAQVAITRATQLAPHDAHAWLLAGQIAAASHDDMATEIDYRRALLITPTLPDAREHLTTLLLGQGRADSTLALITSSPAPSLRESGAVAALHQGMLSWARAWLSDLPDSPYRAVADHWQGTATDWAALGFADLSAGYPRLAASALDQALATDPRYSTGYAYLAWARWSMHDIPSTQAALDQAVTLGGENDLTIGLRALITASAGQTSDALRSLHTWRDNHEPTLALWAIIGQVAQQGSDIAFAEDAWWHCATLTRDRDQLTALKTLANFYLDTALGRDNGREEWAITTARQIAPIDADVLDLAARWAWSQGRMDQALTLAQQAVALDPRSPAKHAHLGALERQLGDLSSAQIEIDRATGLDPSYQF